MKLDEIKKLKEKFDSETTNTYKEFVCVVEDDGNDDPTCVIDLLRRDDCIYGNKYEKKEDCPYWIEKTRHRQMKDTDVWEWLECQAKE